MEPSSPNPRDRSRVAGTNDDDSGAAAKLIPEWGVRADDQVIFAGIAVVLILAVVLGWNAWRGTDDGVIDQAAIAAPADDDAAGDDAADDDEGGDGERAGAVPVASQPTTTTTEADTTTTAEAATTTEAALAVGDVQAAVDPEPGAITGTADGTIAVLEGFVANDAERTAAGDAAAAVEGITEVQNNLELLEPAVADTLTENGVVGATAVGVGTEITVSGTIESEDDRAPAIAAAEAVEGVTAVVDDRLNVSVTADLNALPQVQFATNSAEILPVSFSDLDAAAELLADAGDARIEVQGYTDIEGDEADNLTLSQERADAVRGYLVDAGADPDVLSATGFGETEEFGADLASNRLVRFQQVDQ